MGHRAFVAYERPDETYNLHYTHWGGCNLKLKYAITAESPFGDTEPEPTESQAITYLVENLLTQMDDG